MSPSSLKFIKKIEKYSPSEGRREEANPNRRGKCFVKKPSCADELDVEGHVEQRFKESNLQLLKNSTEVSAPSHIAISSKFCLKSTQ